MFLTTTKAELSLMFLAEDGRTVQEKILDLILFGLMIDMPILLKNKLMLLRKELKREDKPIPLSTKPQSQSMTEPMKFHKRKHHYIQFDHNTYMNSI
jgi:hypothetical protein